MLCKVEVNLDVVSTDMVAHLQRTRLISYHVSSLSFTTLNTFPKLPLTYNPFLIANLSLFRELSDARKVEVSLNVASTNMAAHLQRIRLIS